MKLKAHEILDINENLMKFADEDLPLKTAIIVAEDLENLNASYTVIDKKRTELIKKYAKKDENGEIIQLQNGQVTIEDPNEFSKEMTEMLDTEVNVDIKTLNMNDFDGIKITARQAVVLKKMFQSIENETVSTEKVEVIE